MNNETRKGVSSTLILVAIVCLALGGGGGYFFTNNMYQPIIDNYVDLVVSRDNAILTLNTNLDAEKTLYLSQISEMEVNLAWLEDKIADNLQTISEYSTEVHNLDLEVTILNAKKRTLEISIKNYQAEIQKLEEKLEVLEDASGTQYYEWDYQGEWTWTIHIPMSLYMEFYSRDRPSRQKNWINMADDPKDDYYIDDLVDAMERAARTEGFNEIEMVEFVVAFVQALPYTSDSATTGSDEYPRYPIETLFDRGGDCEDTSILTVALLNELGYDVALLIFDEHVAVGVDVDVYGTYWSDNGGEYFYVETTGEGWEIGEVPEDYKDELAYVYPVDE